MNCDFDPFMSGVACDLRLSMGRRFGIIWMRLAARKVAVPLTEAETLLED